MTCLSGLRGQAATLLVAGSNPAVISLPGYRSGHNGAVSKTVLPKIRHIGSNPIPGVIRNDKGVSPKVVRIMLGIRFPRMRKTLYLVFVFEGIDVIVLVLGILLFIFLMSYFCLCFVVSSVFPRIGFSDNDVSISFVRLVYSPHLRG